MDGREQERLLDPGEGKEGAQTRLHIQCTVGDFFERYRVKHLPVVADSCFGGAIWRTAEPTAPPDDRDVPASFRKPPRWAMASCDLNPTPDDVGSGHSPFAARLLQHLKYPDESVFGVQDLHVFIRRTLRSEPVANPLKTPNHMPGSEFVFFRLIDREDLVPGLHEWLAEAGLEPISDKRDANLGLPTVICHQRTGVSFVLVGPGEFAMGSRLSAAALASAGPHAPATRDRRGQDLLGNSWLRAACV